LQWSEGRDDEAERVGKLLNVRDVASSGLWTLVKASLKICGGGLRQKPEKGGEATLFFARAECAKKP
jgi:hypothetical protein